MATFPSGKDSLGRSPAHVFVGPKALLWERGDRGVEEVSTEIENQGARKRRIEQVRVCSRSTARSTGEGGRSTARSTGVHERA